MTDHDYTSCRCSDCYLVRMTFLNNAWITGDIARRRNMMTLVADWKVYQPMRFWWWQN